MTSETTRFMQSFDINDLEAIIEDVKHAKHMVRIGVFGGSFDPVHLGHLIIARSIMEYEKLDWVLFVPARLSPYKKNTYFSPEERFKMLCAAIEGEDQFAVTDIELNRTGPSFTIDTLRDIRALINNDGGQLSSGKAHGKAEMFFILGVDSLIEMEKWKEPHAIANECTILVAKRPSFENYPVPDAIINRSFFVETPLVSISSTWIRERLIAGKSVRYLVPEAVEKYLYSYMKKRRQSE